MIWLATVLVASLAGYAVWRYVTSPITLSPLSDTHAARERHPKGDLE